MNARVSGAWIAKSILYVRVSGVWVAKTVGYKRVAGAWVNFLSILVTASPNPASVAGPRPSQTAATTITHNGGLGSTISSAIITPGTGFTLNNGNTTNPSVTLTTGTTGFYTCTVRTTVTDGAASGYVDWPAQFTMS